jgi:hypothetical protein
MRIRALSNAGHDTRAIQQAFSVNVIADPSCASTSPQAAIIIGGLRNYGIILADNGGSGGLIGTPDARWNDDDLRCLRSLTLADFEPVNVSSLMVSTDSGATSH